MDINNIGDDGEITINFLSAADQFIAAFNDFK